MSLSIMVERQNWPRLSLSRYPFFTFVAHMGPETIELTATQAIVGQQDVFDGFGMQTGSSEPRQDRVFLEALHPTDTANAHPLGDQRQAFDDFLLWRPPAVKERARCLTEGLPAACTLVALTTLPAAAKLDDIRFSWSNWCLPYSRQPSCGQKSPTLANSGILMTSFSL
ncbi:MAG: hypothetical protein R3A44_32190 [Caldilineaceae bacterium]